MRSTFGLLVALTIAASNMSCERGGGRGKLLRGDVRGCQIWLTEEGSIDLTLQLHVTVAGQTRSEFVIDKSQYAMLRLIKHKDQVLVANGKYIFAAVDAPSGQITHYADLPVTIWDEQGEVIDAFKWSDGPARMRSGFPERTGDGGNSANDS